MENGQITVTSNKDYSMGDVISESNAEKKTKYQDQRSINRMYQIASDMANNGMQFNSEIWRETLGWDEQQSKGFFGRNQDIADLYQLYADDKITQDEFIDRLHGFTSEGSIDYNAAFERGYDKYY